MEINNTTVTKFPSFGNGLVPNHDVSPGDVLISIPSPYLLVVEKEALDKVCSYCLLSKNPSTHGRREPVILKKCVNCKVPQYCSTSCQRAHWKAIHKQECPCLKPLPQIPPTPTRALMQLLLKHQYGMSTDPAWGKLSRHDTGLRRDQRKWEEIVMQAGAAVEFTKVEDMWLIMATEAIVRMTTNAFRATLADDEPVGLCFEPVLAIANHSCTPNALVIFSGRSVALSALNPIKKGEQIFISYIDTAQTTKNRQAALESRYFFACTCPACAKGITPYDTFLRNTPSSPGLHKILFNTDSLIKTAETNNKTISQLPPRYLLSISEKASLWLQENKAKKPNRLIRLHLLEDVLSLLSPLAKKSLFAIQPRQNVLHEIFLHHINTQSFIPALVITVFMALNIDPFVYPQPWHPVRVIRLWTIAKLLLTIAQGMVSDPDNPPEPTDFFKGCGREVIGTISEMDLISTFHSILYLVREGAAKSHGPPSDFYKMVVKEISEIEGVQNERAAAGGPKITEWGNGRGENAVVRGVIEGVRKLGRVECVMEVVRAEEMPMFISGLNSSVEEAECSAE